MSLPELRYAESEERSKVIKTVMLGFAADPLARWIWPESSIYWDAADGFDAFGGPSLTAGTTSIVEKFEGAAMWMPPGVHSDGDAFMNYLEETVDNDRLENIGKVFEEMDGYHPEEPCWYLPIIAVDPAHQGRGLGAALMKNALKRVDEDGLMAYLESSNPRNISLYERHGFEVMGEIQAGDSPVVTPMLRQSR